MDADTAGRDRELSSLRERNAILASDIQKASLRASQAWDRVKIIEDGKREADRKAAELQAENTLLMTDIEALQTQLSDGGGSLWSSLTSAAAEAGRTSGSLGAAAGGGGSANAERLQEEVEGLYEQLKAIPGLHADWERERVEWSAKDAVALADNAALRDQLAEQAAQLRDQAGVVEAAVDAHRKSNAELVGNMERILLGKVEAAEQSRRLAESATAAETERARSLQERLKDHEDVGKEKADDALAWLESPLTTGPLTPERPAHRRRASSGLDLDGPDAGGAPDESLEEMEMAPRLRMILDYLVHGAGPERPARRILAEMAEACVEEAEALELGRERVGEKRTLMEGLRVSALRRAPEHRGKSGDDLMDLSNQGYDDIVAFATAAASSACGGQVEVLIWSMLQDSCAQRLDGNHYKEQLQRHMQAKMDQLDSAHQREAAAADAEAEAALKRASNDSLRSSGTGPAPGLLSSLRGSLPKGAGPGVVGGGGAQAAASISEVMDAPNAHVNYLWKRGAVNRSWKHRWCELKGDRLLYYTAVNDATPRGVINLSECEFDVGWNGGSRKHAFKLIGSHGDGTRTVYMLAADNAGEKESWLEMIQEACRPSGGGGGGGGVQEGVPPAGT